jgi:hypothetical protein
MKLNENLRNFLIIAVLAALVAFTAGGGTAAAVVGQTVSIAFLGAMAWIASRLYREHRVALYSLGDRRRAAMYVAVGALILALTAYSKMTATGPGTVGWLLIVAGAVAVLIGVFRSARNY